MNSPAMNTTGKEKISSDPELRRQIEGEDNFPPGTQPPPVPAAETGPREYSQPSATVLSLRQPRWVETPMGVTDTLVSGHVRRSEMSSVIDQIEDARRLLGEGRDNAEG